MGRIRISEIKKASARLLEIDDTFTLDFEKNKKIVNEIGLVKDKRMRNKLVGYVTRLAKIKARTKPI